MSVLACDRENCNNVMCDRMSYKYGYICDECFEELVAEAPGDIYLFMQQPKQNTDRVRNREQFEKTFTLRD
jgi:hypothetical protein